MRYSISGPDVAPGPGGAVVSCARTHPAPTWLHGTLARAVPPAAAAPAVVPATSKTALRRAVMVREVRHALMPSWTPPGRARLRRHEHGRASAVTPGDLLVTK